MRYSENLTKTLLSCIKSFENSIDTVVFTCVTAKLEQNVRLSCRKSFESTNKTEYL